MDAIPHPFLGGMVSTPLEILTVGHSNHSPEAFHKLVQRHRVTVVADVRSVPYSRRHPHFKRSALEQALGERNARYLFLGAELGARSKDPCCYDDDGRVRFSRLARTEIFIRGIERVIEEAASNRVALMCAERDPANCHRAILVAPVLRERGVVVRHILADGSLESQEQLRERLCETRDAGTRPLSNEGTATRGRDEAPCARDRLLRPGPCARFAFPAVNAKRQGGLAQGTMIALVTRSASTSSSASFASSRR